MSDARQAPAITVETSDVLAPEVLAIRRAVFIDEQGIPEAAELDGTDGGCTHWLLRSEGTPVATLRTATSDDVLRIGRVATLAPARGRGHARRLMDAAMAHGRSSGLTTARLSAQQGVVAWYERLGFVAEGPFYDDGGIPHRDMRAAL